MLEIKDLSKTYQSGDHALKKVSLKVKKGEVVAIIGPSGAGKSTLIRCINSLVVPSGGKIFLDNEEISNLSKKELRKVRRKMGMIFQEYALVERLTVMENILSGRLGYVGFWKSFFRKFPQEDINEAYSLLKRISLEDQVNKRADKLSGGQRQRVGIARALIQNPSLLLVDEPTASLDPKTARQIMRLITELSKERSLTVLINIHDVSLSKQFVNRVIGMREGKIVYDDSSDNLNIKALTMIYGEEEWDTLGEEIEGEEDSKNQNSVLENKDLNSSKIIMEV